MQRAGERQPRLLHRLASAGLLQRLAHFAIARHQGRPAVGASRIVRHEEFARVHDAENDRRRNDGIEFASARRAGQARTGEERRAPAPPAVTVLPEPAGEVKRGKRAEAQGVIFQLPELLCAPHLGGNAIG